MKIIGWNCNGAFRKKSEQILSMNPDILIVSECENIERLKIGKNIPIPNDVKWFGDNPNKGIGIFSYGDFKFELMEEYNPSYKLVIPLKVISQNKSFLLFCVWTKENKYNKEAGYIGQAWYAINYYVNLLKDHNVIIIGDFNSNKRWDSKRPNSNHSKVVNYLEKYNIDSLYHSKFQENQGEESIPTFFLQKNRNKPYHIDYCFASKAIYKKNYKVKIGDFEEWIQISDHVPISVELSWVPQKDKIKNSLEFSIQQKLNLVNENQYPGLSKIKEQTLNMASSYINDESEENENIRVKVIENTEKLLAIFKLINEIDKR